VIKLKKLIEAKMLKKRKIFIVVFVILVIIDNKNKQITKMYKNEENVLVTKDDSSEDKIMNT
jgi:hypothetical protein